MVIETRRIILSTPIEVVTRTSAANLLQEIGFPVRIDLFERMTGEKTDVPGDAVRMYEEIPLRYRGVFDFLLQGAERIKGNAVFAGWSDEHVAIAARYAMKLRAEQLANREIYDPQLVTN